MGCFSNEAEAPYVDLSVHVVPVMAAGLTEVLALTTLFGAAATKAASKVVRTIDERILVGFEVILQHSCFERLNDKRENLNG